jgi:hypothetical protein
LSGSAPLDSKLGEFLTMYDEWNAGVILPDVFAATLLKDMVSRKLLLEPLLVT